jgi:tripartite-type tricarboxylate transporter receptor subunit TctC
VYAPRLVHALAVAAISVASRCAAQPVPVPQEYPSFPIHIIVPAAPGGASDLVARQVGEQLGIALHTAVVIDNKPGASGLIGNELAAHAAPDGYTLLFASSATHVIAAHAIAKLPYDPLQSFEPIVNIGYLTSVVVVNPALPVHTVAELIAYARARPGTLNYASSGVGSANHIDTEVLAALAGMDLVHIPYRGTADGYRALLANEVQVMVGAMTSALPYIQDGRLRALAVLVDRRSPLLPDVPTIAQAGLGRVDVRKWFGLVAPANTPAEIVERLNHTLDQVLHEPQMRAWMERHGFELAGGTARDFDETIRTDYAKWGETMRRLHVHSE